MSTQEMKINAIAPYFGANRKRAEMVGRAFGRVAWACVPFMGGGSELPHIDCVEGVASDLSRHVINLAGVIGRPELLARLTERLDRTLFHEETFRESQRACAQREEDATGSLFAPPNASSMGDTPDVDWAYEYFVACWMGPGEAAGKASHFEAYFPVRYSSSGGASSKRFRSAVESLDAWCAALRNWQFVREDAMSVLDRVVVRDAERLRLVHDAALVNKPVLDAWGVYCDPPWPEAGREYAHGVDDSTFHKALEAKLRKLTTCRVVVRYGDHPLIRGLYQDWHAVEHETKNQAGNTVPELLFSNEPFQIEEVVG